MRDDEPTITLDENVAIVDVESEPTPEVPVTLPDDVDLDGDDDGDAVDIPIDVETPVDGEGDEDPDIEVPVDVDAEGDDDGGDEPAIDLRGRIRAYLIQVRDRGGALVEGKYRRTDPLVPAEVGYRGFSGVILLAASTPTIDLSVEGPSGVRQDFREVRAGDVLVLD